MMYQKTRLKEKAATWWLPALLTAVAVVWTVVAVGDILTAQAAPVFAYSVAVVYDAVWLYALHAETTHRRQGSKATLPKVIGWTFLPLTVGALAAHGLLAGSVLAAIVGALVPVLSKVTLVLAIDRDRTRINPRVQEAIDRTRAATRDRIAVSRAVAAARDDEMKAAADILKRSRQAEAEAVTTAAAAHEQYAETAGRHERAELPALISDRELEAIVMGTVPDELERSSEPVNTPVNTPVNGWTPELVEGTVLREEILRLTADGIGQREIARRLGCSPSYVNKTLKAAEDAG